MIRNSLPAIFQGTAFATAGVVVSMQVNARRERARPFHHRRIEMRMRDRDSIDATKSFDHRYGCIVESGDAVPQNIAVFRAQEQRALPNGECRRRANADDGFIVFTECIRVVLP